jgi:hypothetical protein
MNAMKKTHLGIRSAFAALAFSAVALTLANCTSTNSPPIIILTPLPTAVPTTPPTPAPSALTSNISSVAFTVVGQNANFTVSENGYGGALTATSTCAGIATFSPASGTGPSALFTVTSVAAGTCTVTVKDASNQAAAVGVTVTTTSVTAN